MCRVVAGSEKLSEPGGVMEITQAPHDKFAPQTIAFIYQEVVRFFAVQTRHPEYGWLPGAV